MVPTPEQYAEAAVRAIGYETEISPYWAHYAFVGVCKALPEFAINKYCVGAHNAIRKRGMAKLAEGKKE